MFSRKFIIRTLAAIGIYIAIASYVFKNEAHYFFDHKPIEVSKTYQFHIPFKELNIPINKDIHLHGLFFTHEKPKGLILLFPSGDHDAEDFDPRDFFLYRIGYNLIIPDYRGTGKSNSQYDLEGDMYQDALQWYRLSKRMADSSTYMVYGQDFGTGMAAWVGGKHQVDLVILENPYFSWDEIMLKKYFWWLPHTYFTHYHIPLWQFLRKSMNRNILIHASANHFIPYENSQRLLEFFKPGDELITTEGERVDQNSADFQHKLEKFLK